ncbi:hypothetical protein [Nonlabens agnitus]|uniref:Lipocalin-like domain-containing protein n=1 Tax=Nonlabens agnitus TaxID=870484 RepID=A0A2S9WTP8_9FLAO|nr:hypothetical protein [Nonlabens agnitus]PRP66840.1 hypothetical protein BST86_06850 [Nonlabens agnitus]
MKTTLLLFSLIVLASCGAYNENSIAYYKNPLSSNDVSRLDGLYHLKATQIYRSDGTIDSCAVASNDLLNINLRMVATNDSVEKYQIRIRAIDQNTLKTTLIKNGENIDSSIINGKISKKGMFHFKNNPVDCYGIPYILGGCSGTKSRIGIDHDNNLILQNNSYSGGAILLLLGDGRCYSTAYNFARIQSN